MALGQLFSQRVGYAVHALCYMAKTSPENGLTTVPQLADWMHRVWPETSETYLASIVRRLVRGGILISQRGVSGGYGFARSPLEVSLCDVVAVLEGVSYARCALTPTGKCPLQYRCKNFRRLCQLKEKYTDLLAEVSIADLANDIAAPIPEAQVDNCTSGFETAPTLGTVKQ